jgi:hypothetical protein
MSTGSNKAAVRRSQDAFNAGDLEGVDKLTTNTKGLDLKLFPAKKSQKGGCIIGECCDNNAFRKGGYLSKV